MATDEVSIQMTWVGAEEAAVSFVNQFLLQLDVDRRAVFLTAGVATPPVVLGTEEERLDQLKRYPFVPIHPVARLGMTRERFGELRDLINRVHEQWPASGSDEGTEA